MASSPTQPTRTPPTEQAIPDSYAIFIDTDQIHVWQYQVTLDAPDGDWHYLETLSQADRPRISIEYATVEAPTTDGYWIYRKTYSCELDCA